MKSIRTVVTGAFLCASVATQSETLALYPVPTGAETAHFDHGVPTLNLETDTGAIEITPLPFDHGHVAFGLSIYNKGQTASNFGIENVAVTVNDAPVTVLSEQELEKRAKSRAMWSQIGIAMLAGAAAGLSANAYTTNTYHGRLYTPHGTYAWRTSYRDNTIGVLGATAAIGAGTAGIVGVQNRLDYTLHNLASDAIQTTTVDGDASYGGKLTIEKVSKAKPPYDVHLLISWNGATYPFVFRVTPQGTNMPAAYSTPPVVAPVAASAPVAVVASAAITAAPVAPISAAIGKAGDHP